MVLQVFSDLTDSMILRTVQLYHLIYKTTTNHELHDLSSKTCDPCKTELGHLVRTALSIHCRSVTVQNL